MYSQCNIYDQAECISSATSPRGAQVRVYLPSEHILMFSALVKFEEITPRIWNWSHYCSLGLLFQSPQSKVHLNVIYLLNHVRRMFDTEGRWPKYTPIFPRILFVFVFLPLMFFFFILCLNYVFFCLPLFHKINTIPDVFLGKSAD